MFDIKQTLQLFNHFLWNVKFNIIRAMEHPWYAMSDQLTDMHVHINRILPPAQIIQTQLIIAVLAVDKLVKRYIIMNYILLHTFVINME